MPTHTPDTPSPSAPPRSPGTGNRGACEACRAKKIRCDKICPCSHCQRANVDCTRPKIRPREKRTRILLTTQYENKIDQMSHRLAHLAEVIENHQARCESLRPAITVSSLPRQSVPSKLRAERAHQGTSSLAAHSVFVTEFLRQRTDHAEVPANESLDALAHMQHSQVEEGRVMADVPAVANGARLPPLEKVVPLIRMASAQRLVGAALIYQFILIKSFSDICFDVYFSDDCSDLDSIIVNAGLFSLCYDYANVADLTPEQREEYSAYTRLCQGNVDTKLANLPLHLHATERVIAALLFGASHQIEIANTSLCWSLSSKASELCQTLGYHQNARMHNANPADSGYKQFLFWNTYFIDKSLSLRLGRASTISDGEITIDLPSLSTPGQEPVLTYFALWVRSARCQGMVYDLLYSPRSASQPDQARQSSVQFLVSSLDELQQLTDETNDKWIQTAKDNSGADLMDFYAASDDVLRLSLLTHVYRAGPKPADSTTSFSPDCIKTARATLDRHEECMSIIKKTDYIHLRTYMHWTLLFTPFVPFFVIFCHAIEALDQSDVAMISRFVTSVDPASAISKPAGDMYRLFLVLSKAAQHHVQSRLSSSSTLRENHESELDSNNNTTMGHGQFSDNPLLWEGSGTQLQDWLWNDQAWMEGMLAEFPPT